MSHWFFYEIVDTASNFGIVLENVHGLYPDQYGRAIYHRENGPAYIASNGNKWWYHHGKCHREDGPAIEYANGTKSWCLQDKLHREDGPAVECADGDKFWYLNGYRIKCQSQEQFLKLMKLKAFW